MKKCYLIIFFICTNPLTYAADVKCDNSILEADSLYDLPGAGYWMQAMGDCRLTYTSVGGLSSKMYNMCTRQSEPITELIDAYGLPEGDLYVHPSDGSGLKFYKTSDALKNGTSAMPFYSDKSHLGNYESIGLLSSTGDERKIRVIMGNKGGTFRDYIIKKNNDNFEVQPIQTAPVAMCKNIPSGGLDREVPVLSRDGQYIAGRDLGNRVMKIYKFDPNTGDCEMVNEIPMVTSKVSFSFDNKHVLFVVNDPNTRKGRLLQMDINTGDIKTISSPTENVQYVTAKKSGEILYSRISDKGNGSTSTLVKLKSGAVADVSDTKPYDAIGLLWARQCNMKIDLDYATAIGQRISKESCLLTVKNSNIQGLEADYQNLKKKDLEKICNIKVATTTSTSQPGQGGTGN